MVMTEWGAEARPELANAPESLKGSYAFQTMHARRTLDVIDRRPCSPGPSTGRCGSSRSIPGWSGGAGRRPAPYAPNTRHQKGLLDYYGAPKPAYFVVRDRFRATPLYP